MIRLNKKSGVVIFFVIFLQMSITFEDIHDSYQSRNRLEFQGVSCGATDQSRTGDLILTKDALYLLSYSSILRRGPRRQLLYLRGALLSNIIMRTDKIFLLFPI